MKKHGILFSTAIFLALTASPEVDAVQGGLSARVLTTLVDANLFGRCMAFLDRPIAMASNSPNCPSSWVSFSCRGDFAPKDIAYRMLDQAQLAKALNRPVFVIVDDSKKHNGFCFANRIDVR
ncbi:MAG: hypothetical protein ACU843_12810 [Gammaproteobacteria bacterium]